MGLFGHKENQGLPEVKEARFTLTHFSTRIEYLMNTQKKINRHYRDLERSNSMYLDRYNYNIQYIRNELTNLRSEIFRLKHQMMNTMIKLAGYSKDTDVDKLKVIVDSFDVTKMITRSEMREICEKRLSFNNTERS